VAPARLRLLEEGHSLEIEGVRVTALKAYSMPGAVMLLFQPPGGSTSLNIPL
jgi:hypothetical protein